MTTNPLVTADDTVPDQLSGQCDVETLFDSEGTVLHDRPQPAMEVSSRTCGADAPTEPDPREGGEQSLDQDPPLPAGYAGYTPVVVLHETSRCRVTLYQGPDGEEVVLKVFRTRRTDLPQIWEAWNSAARRGPLVQIREHGMLNGAAWELMPYRRGGALGTRRRSDTELRILVKQITDALESLHRPVGDEGLSLVHRDLKPSNVLIRESEPLQIELADTDLVQFISPMLSRDPQVAGGTEQYMAPEADITIHPPGDFWSLGVLLAYLGTGRHPYQSKLGRFLSPEHIRRNRRERLPEIPDGLPADLAHLARGLITRDTNYRFGASQVRACLAGDLPPLPPEHVREYVPESGGPFLEVTVDDTSAASDESTSVADRASFLFDGLPHTRPATLAAAFAGSWTLAAQLLLGRDQTVLRQWLSDIDPARGNRLATTLAQLQARTISVHRAIAEAIHILDPDRPPSFFGYEMQQDNLLMIAGAAAAGDDVAATAVNHLAASNALEVLARHRGQDRLALIGITWQTAVLSARQLLIRHVADPPQGYDSRLAATLLVAVLDRVHADELVARGQERAADPRAILIHWFGQLAAAQADELSKAAALVTAYPLTRMLAVPVRPELDEFAREYLREALAGRAQPRQAPPPVRQLPVSIPVVVALVILAAHAWALFGSAVGGFILAGGTTAAALAVLAVRLRQGQPGIAAALITIGVWGAGATVLGTLVAAILAWLQPAALQPAMILVWMLWALVHVAAAFTAQRFLASRSTLVPDGRIFRP